MKFKTPKRFQCETMATSCGFSVRWISRRPRGGSLKVAMLMLVMETLNILSEKLRACESISFGWIVPIVEGALVNWAWRASIMPWEKSVASMRAGWASEGRAERRAREAVPIPLQ